MSYEVLDHQKTCIWTKLTVEEFSTFQLLNIVVGDDVLGQGNNLLERNMTDGAHVLECCLDNFLIDRRLVMVRINCINIVSVLQSCVM